MLVDEFQDTDPVQWDIMRRAFGAGGGTLVLIGDPKQAIYAFRGADVYAYLEAARAAGARATLRVNWRSDQGLIDAYDALFGGARLGHEGIDYRRVRAADANRAPRLSRRARRRAAARAGRCTATTPGDHAHARAGSAPTPSAREHDRRGPRRRPRRPAVLDARGSSAAPTTARRSRDEPVRPGHVAVLVRTHRNAALIRDALDAVGIPAVINGAGSVFGTAPARDVAAAARGDRAADVAGPRARGAR